MSSKTPDCTQKITRDRTQVIVLGAMCLALFMTNFEGTAMDVALPQIQKNLGANVLGLQWILNAYLLPVASLLLASGKFGDTFGRRRIFLLGLIIFTVSSALCGFASNLELLIAGRVLQGIGAAVLIPLSLTIVTAIFPDPKERTKAIGIWSAVSALGMVAGPGLGGLLVDILGWQSIFLCNVPLGIMTLIMTCRGVKEDQNMPEQHLDLPGLVLSITAIASLTYVLTQGSTSAWLTPPMIGLLTVSVLSFLGFWLVESRSSHPIIPMTLLRNQTFAAIISTQTLVFFASGGLFFILSLFLQQVQGYSAAATGLCFLPMNAAIILAAFTSGWVAARLGWRFPVLSGLVIASIAILSLTQTQVDTKYGEILGYLMLSGFGGGLTIAPLATAAMSAVLPAQEGIASAVSSMSIQFGGILGIAIQGAILSQRLTSKLRQSLIEWNVPSDLQDKIIAEALHNLAKVPINIPSTISPLVLHQEIRTAFVSGLHATLFVAGSAMFLGIGVILILVPSNLKPRSQA
jgi:MFS transporter, DHA2 family, methylenomycin A resistance protein